MFRQNHNPILSAVGVIALMLGCALHGEDHPTSSIFTEATAAKRKADDEWGQIKDLDRAQEFGLRLDSVAGLMRNADKHFSQNNYGAALPLYVQALAAVKPIQQTQQQRQAAIEVRKETESARQKAEEVKAVIEGASLWSEAEEIQEHANRCFDAADFQNAPLRWRKASDLFGKAREKAIQARDTAGKARLSYEKQLDRYDRDWFARFGGEIWRKIVQLADAAGKAENDGRYSEAMARFEEAESRLLDAAREAKPSQDQEQLRLAREAHQVEWRRHNREQLAKNGGEAWKSMSQSENSAEQAVRLGYIAEASYSYLEAARFLVEAGLRAEKSRLESLSRQLSLDAQTSLRRPEIQRLTEEAEKAANQAEKLTRRVETQRAIAEDQRQSQLQNYSRKKFSSENARLATNARKLYQNGDIAGAGDCYEKILETDPRNFFALSDLAVVRFNQNRLEEAEATLRAVLSLDPYDGFSLSILGIILCRQKMYDEAAGLLRLAVAITPNHPEPHVYLGIFHLKKNHFHAAEQELLRAIQLNPNFAEAHFNLAVLFASQNPPSLELARKHYRTALKLGQTEDAEIERVIFGRNDKAANP
ncbi:MAG: tetratricopeptide repeat protein [Verrucomicrobia bacterium]|nr:tetratricopeptide repeat protein [Verrucomicrobiota bacterium]